MAVYDEIRKCIAFLGFQTQLGFRPEGTGFLVGYTDDDYDFGYLVTAAHVVWPTRWRESSKPHQNLCIRVNTRAGLLPPIKTAINEWCFHQDKRIDICAIPTTRIPPGSIPNDQETDIVFINLPAMVGRGGAVALGDEVFIPGAFVGRIGERRNIPIVRIANIAAMPEEPIAHGSPRRTAFLIETRSLGGASGSPIFVNLGPSTKGQRPPAPAPYVNRNSDQTGHPRASLVMPYLLVGMVLGSHSGQYAEDFLSEDDSDIKPPKDADFNAGISVAMTAEDIVDFVTNDPELKKRRGIVLDDLRKAAGYRPSSASSSREKNPTHREDFTSLLNAAAKTKPQGDQT
jgi:hypothetical protein